ncbi:reductase flavoprotein subunit [Subtercola boreus]|uniref:Reductase flavoprotein subunit n=1 Tax=Subtercola boreus TaxID=120213 RepID=A0A3E0VMN1_9MICO|nr:FAD-dependent oxidoreductase [Subtercola boreus]RFA10879.1 reductase flavoprotein subunit [Subtercola boreus]TQL55538.1 fumarate reductase flavoprotein subunit [Subtercola boreus]
MKTERNTCDVVVLGAGIAGLAAACRATDEGLSVVLVEKSDAVGGSSAMSGGFFAFSGTDEQCEKGVEDSAELFLADMLAVGQNANDESLLRAYLDEQAEVYAWLKSRGVVFRALELSSGQSVPRSHLSDIKDVLTMLADQFVAAGGLLLVDSRATRLVQDAERVTGVHIESPSGPQTLTATSGVVVATGGFSRSAELLKIFAPEQLAAIPYGGRANTGDGLTMAWMLGAGLADMSYVSATYGSHPDTTEAFHELLTAYYLGAIIVNSDGRRFVDESQSYKTLGMACLAQPNGLGFEVFDSVVRAKSHPGVPLNDIGMLEDLGHVFRADTLTDLAELAGIDAAALEQTVERYNTAVRGLGDDEFQRNGLCNGVGELLPIVAPPFYAYPAKALMTSTYCGLTIRPDGRVLRVDGSAIDGLYAIGEVTGGFHGAAYMTGTSLGKGAVFGSIVAKTLRNARE